MLNVDWQKEGASAMNAADFIHYALVAVGIIAFCYVLVRTMSIAHYRTRQEYDRGEIPSKKRKEDHA